ncbi:pyridoxal 5'-phosphate synthase [Aureococcus anophagefferens]|nr:pyridoxal 5'-phosphate synthase [Aureococcus anophagefferens]
MRSHFRSLQRVARRAPHRAARPTTQQTSRGFSAASLWIDGAPCGASDGAWLDVRSPRDDGVFGALSDASADDAARAVGAAQRVHDAGAWAADAPRRAARRAQGRAGRRRGLPAGPEAAAAAADGAVLRELLGPCAPRGAVNLLTGGPPSTPAARATEALTRDPRVALASFTGSGRGGAEVLKASAANLRPTSLELGGKGALLVLDDADVDAAADFAALGILQCSGQVDAVVVGDPLDEASTMGPVVSEAQRAKIEDAVAAAVSTGGAELVSKPVDVDATGYYVAPAVLRNPRDDAPAWTEEIFGPVLCAARCASAVAALAGRVLLADRDRRIPRHGLTTRSGRLRRRSWDGLGRALEPIASAGPAPSPSTAGAHRRGGGRRRRHGAERIPADIRKDGGVARMSDPKMIAGIKAAVTIPVMAKARIGHHVEAQILEASEIDYIDESEVLTMADEDNHINKNKFTGEAGTGNIVEAVRHARTVQRELKMLQGMDEDELFVVAKNMQAPYHLVAECAKTGKLPVVNFAAGGVATPADAALMMQLGMDGVFVGSGIFKSEDPMKRAKAIVRAVAHYNDAKVLLGPATMARILAAACLAAMASAQIAITTPAIPTNSSRSCRSCVAAADRAVEILETLRRRVKLNRGEPEVQHALDWLCEDVPEQMAHDGLAAVDAHLAGRGLSRDDCHGAVA